MQDDNLTPLGRADSVVKVLGELVNPEEIERELTAHSEGALAPGSFAVVAVPDARAGNRLVPVFDVGADAVVIRKVLAIHARQAPGFRRLGPPMVLNPLPRSPLGKPLRAEIVAWIAVQDRPL
jgi:acyl-coenzyme A synthetase/AMP-(fatty) acid ligase